MLLSKTRSVSPGSDGITVYTGSEDLAVHLLRLCGILFHAQRIIFNINLPMFVMSHSICKSEGLLVTAWHLPCSFSLCTPQQNVIFKVGRLFPSSGPHHCRRSGLTLILSPQRTRTRGLLMRNRGLLPSLNTRSSYTLNPEKPLSAVK